MITATLTSNRHIAGANAAYAATIPADPESTPPYANVEEYVQAALERVADSWIETTKVDQITVGDFILRFTPEEYAAITGSVDAQVLSILAHLRSRANVRLGSAEAINGIAYLVSVGLLTSERGAAVLEYTNN